MWCQIYRKTPRNRFSLNLRGIKELLCSARGKAEEYKAYAVKEVKGLDLVPILALFQTPHLEYFVVEGRTLEVEGEKPGSVAVIHVELLEALKTGANLFQLVGRNGEDHLILACACALNITGIGNGYAILAVKYGGDGSVCAGVNAVELALYVSTGHGLNSAEHHVQLHGVGVNEDNVGLELCLVKGRGYDCLALAQLKAGEVLRS